MLGAQTKNCGIICAWMPKGTCRSHISTSWKDYYHCQILRFVLYKLLKICLCIHIFDIDGGKYCTHVIYANYEAVHSSIHVIIVAVHKLKCCLT